MADRLDLNYKACELRRKFNEDIYSPIDLFSLVNNIDDLTIVYYPFSENISGMCVKNEGANVIAVNSLSTKGRIRFSLAHELYHLYYGNSDSTISYLNFDSDNKEEECANIFASYLIITYEGLRKEIELISNNLILKNVISIAIKYGLSFKAIAYRLYIDNFIDDIQYTEFMNYKNIKDKANKFGFDISIFQNENGKKATYGNYIKQINELDKLNMISKGKKRELLIKAFRDDLAYDQEGKNIIDD